jgi:hypothetical protein
MRRLLSRTLPAVLVFTLAAGAAHSVQITYLAEGLLYAPPDGLPSLAINDPWKLTFTIDYGVAGSGDSTEKTYPGAIVAYTLILEPSTPLLTVTDTSADIKVHNEAGNDFFLVHDTAVPATTLDGKVLYEIGFFVSDSIGTALDNTDIPGSALLTDLSPFWFRISERRRRLGSRNPRTNNRPPSRHRLGGVRSGKATALAPLETGNDAVTERSR